VERWQTRAIWIISRADAAYPRRFKMRLREDAPPILYGCGNLALLETGGLAVVGSRHVTNALSDYTASIGRQAAHAGRTLISGGARGIDQAAMRGALEAGGKACGVLADSLEKTTMLRENRNLLLHKQLVLISPYDPNAGFNVGNAMQRNKLIYALADASLVVNSDLNKGGTWAGAVEQLDKLKFVPVFVRSVGEPSDGLDALRKKGAFLWPNPTDYREFERVFDTSFSSSEPPPSPESTLLLPFGNGAPSNNSRYPENPQFSEEINEPRTPYFTTEQATPPTKQPPPLRSRTETPENTQESIHTATEANSSPAETLFATVREVSQRLLNEPLKEAEFAAALSISPTQAKSWLQRLVAEGLLDKLDKPTRYVLTSPLSTLEGKKQDSALSQTDHKAEQR
jgi:predicted Rossmann fold nucleotide-binding protein DprA/Smf involved in DNA uptake